MSDASDLLVHCGQCGKKINPATAYYVFRRTAKPLLSADGWDYIVVSPMFYACSYEHLQPQVDEVGNILKQQALDMFHRMPDISKHNE